MTKDRTRRRSIPAPYGKPVYGRSQPRDRKSLVVAVSLRPDSEAAVMALVNEHNLSRSGAAHHLIRLGAGLPPLPPL